MSEGLNNDQYRCVVKKYAVSVVTNNMRVCSWGAPSDTFFLNILSSISLRLKNKYSGKYLSRQNPFHQLTQLIEAVRLTNNPCYIVTP